MRACVRQMHIAESELLVIAPDLETQRIVQDLVREYGDRSDWPKDRQVVRFIRDAGIGKPAAINLALREAYGDIFVMTDGDVVVDQGAIDLLIAPFLNSRVGATTGRVMATDDRRTKYGFWAHVLTDAGAHETRLHAQKNGNMIECSGYLMAVRKILVGDLPEEGLIDDSVLSHQIIASGSLILYVPEAIVRVTYPTHFSDWKKQKIRTVGGYHQQFMKNKIGMRSFGQEIFGVLPIFRYPRSMREWWWLGQLFFARLYVWVAAIWYVRVLRRSLSDIWKPVASTKRRGSE